MVIPARCIPSVLIALAVAMAAPSVLAVNQQVRACLGGQNHLIAGTCTAGLGSPTVAGAYQVRVDRSGGTCSTTCSDSSETCSSDSQCKEFNWIEVYYDPAFGEMAVVIVNGASWTAVPEPSNHRWVLSGPGTQYLEYAIQLAGSVSIVGPTIRDGGYDLGISGDDEVPSILEPTPAVSPLGLAVLVAVLLGTGLLLIGRRHRDRAAPAKAVNP